MDKRWFGKKDFKLNHLAEAVYATSPNIKKYDASVTTQCLIILDYFQHISPQLTVSQGRDILGIMSLSARIAELRKQSWDIRTTRITETDRNGVKHYNGLYSYHGRLTQLEDNLEVGQNGY